MRASTPLSWNVVGDRRADQVGLPVKERAASGPTSIPQPLPTPIPSAAACRGVMGDLPFQRLVYRTGDDLA